MLQQLKFVQGAVSKKDFLPALTHFKIQNGTVRSYNGMLALSSPIALDIDCTPKAEPLVKAIQHCDDTATLTLTPTGRLSIKSGVFRALIDCVQDETPHVLPEGEFFDIDGEALVAAFKVLNDFIGDDASRPWSNGVLLSGCSAFATNNIVLLEYWVGKPFPITCNVPRQAIKEMLRIGEAPIRAQSCNHSITFHYSDGRWVRTQLLATDWPDVSAILAAPCNPVPVDERLYEGLAKIKPFADKLGRVFINKGHLSTHTDEAEGASYFVPEMTEDGIYQIEMLQLLQGVAEMVDFTTYPSPCMFRGKKLRGAIIGMRA